MVDSVLTSLPYIPGIQTTKTELLSRYLPPIPDGVISSWLLQNIPTGSWVLDPFGASPRLAIEAAKAGYRLFVTANNPISRFLLEIAANPPLVDDLRSALSELAASYKADERIEPHIRSLYNTRCSRCGQIVSADAFLWEQGGAAPYARIFSCPFCGESGEHPVTSFDIDRLKQFSASGLHKARALERVVSATDQDRIHVDQALSVYLPRALYALLTIINKIDALQISILSQKNLTALLLHTFDQANVMWRVPSTRERRRQLNIPRHFRENNIWLSLEQGIELLSVNSAEESTIVPVTIWPDLPEGNNGICVYEGRLSSIIESLSELHFQSVCAAIPRPNQAFWTLSALWSGWLWGREAVGSFKSVLHRQRYDWAWHTTALASVFKQLENFGYSSLPIYGMMGEIEAGFISSTLVATGYAGLDLIGISISNEEAQAQLLWKDKSSKEPMQPAVFAIEGGAQNVKKYLEMRGEPASYLNSLSAALIPILRSRSDWIEEHALNIDNPIQNPSKSSESTDDSEPSPSIMYTRFVNTARDALSYRSGFLHFNLQDISAPETPAKVEITQSTLFAFDAETVSDEGNENFNPTTSNNEAELPSKKEHIAKPSEISESVLIWLRDSQNANRRSISDQIELEVANYLVTHAESTFDEINQMLCGKFRGLLTPDPGFVRICLSSYGEVSPNDEDHWYIRPEDSPSERHSDLDEARVNLHQIGEMLGLTVDQFRYGDIPSITWRDDVEDFIYQFFLTVTANIGEIVLQNMNSVAKAFIVLPGSRASLILYKLRRDPRLKRAFIPSTGNWTFLKFRHLKSMLENPILNRDNLDQILRLDPLTFNTPQLRFI